MRSLSTERAPFGWKCTSLTAPSSPTSSMRCEVSAIRQSPHYPRAMRRARHRPTHQLFEITGSGFIPGEDVTVALVVSSAEGSADGKAHGLVDLSQLADHRSEIMLIGRVSGVIVLERLPS